MEQGGQLSAVTMLKGLWVLVVDDEDEARVFIAKGLEQYGCGVIVAASADEALQVLDWVRPDVLISDIRMPSEDGYALIRKVRALEPKRWKSIPAIAVTAYAKDEDKSRALCAGFQKHVTKPVQALELATLIRELVNK